MPSREKKRNRETSNQDFDIRISLLPLQSRFSFPPSSSLSLLPMGKKPKNSDNTKVNSNADPSSGSASSNIFQTLFGAIPEQQQTSVSLFSEANPFRRKSINDLSQAPNQENQQQQHKKQLGLGFGSAEDAANTTNGEGDNPNLVAVKNRKRKSKDKKKPGLDTGSIYETEETRLEIKKSKKGEPKGSDFGVESEETGENPNYVEVKKRKRNKEKKKPSLDSGSVDETEATHLEITKSKKGEPKGFDTGAELEETGKGKNPNLGMELEVLPKEEEEEGKSQNVDIEVKGMEKKKKKKRKRDEVEAGYEARRYGVVGTDNGGEEEGGLGEKVVGEKRKKVDDPVDLVVKEGFDDEAKLGRTVFVGNLPLKVKKKALVKEFSQYGEVESVRIRSVPLLDSKIPRKGAIIQKKINGAVDSVHAYIVFKTEQPAQASLAHNMAVVGGNHIRVDRACPPRKKLKGEDAPLYDNNRTVFVGNLPFDVKDEEIYQFFSGFKDLESSIEAIRVIRDPGTSLGKGIAYILFKTRGAANLVVKKRSLKLRDRELRLCHARSDRTPSKRTNPSPIRRNDYPTKLAVDSRTPNSNNKVNTKAAASYQGLRGSKSGVQKKVPSKITEAVKFKSRTQKGEKPEAQKGKRLAVAARKARVLQGGGASKQTGKKRKMEIRTPESARLNKKTKKFR